MIDHLDEETLIQWQAVAAIDGWGADNERMAVMCTAIHNAIMLAAGKQGGSINKEDFRDIADFLPTFVFDRKKSRPQSAQEMTAVAKSLAGVR